MIKILLLLLLFSTPLHAEVYGPEPNWEYHVRAEPIVDFDRPSNNQIWSFWILNALDVYTTDRVIRKCPDCKELNPLLSSRPSLEELILHKAILGGAMHKYGSNKLFTVVNGVLSVAVVHNYKLVD